MCDKHKPIVVYDSGGTQTYCEKCGAPLDKWKQSEGSGKHKKSKKETVQNVQQGVK